MSHVDEGTIHAYLDGALAEDPQHARIEAHVAACAECRARLEQERALRDRAAYVLGRTAPDALRVEPFEVLAARRRAMSGTPAELKAREPGAAATRDEAGRRARRQFSVPLTLAATVVLAITAGIIASRLELLKPSTLHAPTVADLEGPRPSADAPRPAEPVGRAAGSVRAAEGALPQDEFARRDAGAPAPPPAAAADQVRALEEKQAETREQERRAVVPPPDSRAASGLRDAQQLQQRPQAQQQQQTALGQQLAAANAPATPGAVPDSLEKKKIDDAVTATWRDITEAEAARMLGRTPAMIEGLSVVATQAATVANQQVVRVIQRVDSLHTVDVMQWPAALALTEMVVTGGAIDSTNRRGEDAAGAAALRARLNRFELAKERDANTASTLVLRILGMNTVALRGNLPADSLQSLARRVR